MIPSRLRLGRRLFPIAVVAGLSRETNCLASIQLLEPRGILIEAAQSQQSREVSLIHELLHGIWPPQHTRADSVIKQGRTEEDLVETLDLPLYSALQDNDIQRLFGEIHSAARTMGFK